MKSPSTSTSVTTGAALRKHWPWQPSERHKRDDHAKNP
jgi:hypothetical protein